MNGNTSGKILLPCSVVYMDKDGDLEISASLILERIHELWGIKVNQIIFKLTNEEPTDWQTALKTAEKYVVNKFRPRLPLAYELTVAYMKKESFENTVRILNRYGVSADIWMAGSYWSKEEYNETQAHVFDMCNGCYHLKPKWHMNGYIRLCYSI